ncbi:MAG: hypothetical protein AB8B50_20985 [Pirellulaceae bacterium]
MHRLFVVGTATLVWGGFFAVSLSIAKLDLGHCQSLCGAWGCLPAIAPLLSVHAMWLTLIGGFTWLALLAFPTLRDWRGWFSVLAASLLGCIGPLLAAGWQYFDAGGSLAGFDWIKFPLFKVISWTDFPIVQIALTSLLSAFMAARLSKQTTNATLGFGRAELEAKQPIAGRR